MQPSDGFDEEEEREKMKQMCVTVTQAEIKVDSEHMLCASTGMIRHNAQRRPGCLHTR